MLTLTPNQILEKNKLAASGCWLELAEVTLPGASAPALYLVNNTADLVYPWENLVEWSNDITHWLAYIGNPARTYGQESWDGSLRATKIAATESSTLRATGPAMTAGTLYRVDLRAKTDPIGNRFAFIVKNTASPYQEYPLYWSSYAAVQDENGWRRMTLDITPAADMPSVVYRMTFYPALSLDTWVADVQVLRPRVSPSPFVLTAGAGVTGTLYQAFPFRRAEIEETGKGQQPLLKIDLGNVDGSVQAYLEANSGLRSAEVRLMLVHSDHLDEAPVQDQTYSVMSSYCTPVWATLELGAASPANRRFPRNRLLKSHCRFKFKDSGCGYTGATTTCNKSLSACRALSNSARFGGFAGIGRGGIYA